VAQFAPSTLVTPSAAVVVVSLTESICGPGGTVSEASLWAVGAYMEVTRSMLQHVDLGQAARVACFRKLVVW
jgi:hypothetical protein